MFFNVCLRWRIRLGSGKLISALTRLAELRRGEGAVILIDVALAGKGQSSRARWLVSQKILNVEELETLPVGIKPRTSHFRSPGGK